MRLRRILGQPRYISTSLSYACITQALNDDIHARLATLGADLCAARVPLAGLVYLCGLLYVGPVMQHVGMPVVLGFCPQLMSNDADVAHRLHPHAHRAAPPLARPTLHTRRLGRRRSRLPARRRAAPARAQDPRALFAAGAVGHPLLALGGADDEQVRATAVVEHMRPHFSEMKSVLLAGVGRMPFYEASGEVAAYILAFVAKCESR